MNKLDSMDWLSWLNTLDSMDISSLSLEADPPLSRAEIIAKVDRLDVGECLAFKTGESELFAQVHRGGVAQYYRELALSTCDRIPDDVAARAAPFMLQKDFSITAEDAAIFMIEAFNAVYPGAPIYFDDGWSLR